MFQTAAINKAQQTTKYVIQCAFNKKIDFIILLRIQAFYVKSKEQEFLVIFVAVHCIMSNYGHIW